MTLLVGRRHVEIVFVKTCGIGVGVGLGWLCSHSSHGSVTITGGGVDMCICSHSSHSVSVTTTTGGGGGMPISSHSGHGNAVADVIEGKKRRIANDKTVRTDIETAALPRLEENE